MAKPDLDDGYLRIAHELFAAVALAGFSKWEWAVIREVFDQIYGPRKGPTAFLYPTRIATQSGTFKESITRAIRTLIDAGVLRRRGEAEVVFIKDYEKWTRAGAPRFSAAEIQYCMRAKRKVVSTSHGNNGATSHKSDSLNAGTTLFPKIADASNSVGNKGAPVGNGAVPKPGTVLFPKNLDALLDPPDPPLLSARGTRAGKNGGREPKT